MVWSPNEMPHTFYLDEFGIPEGEANYLAQLALSWNNYRSLGPVINIQKQLLPISSQVHPDGIDDIRFNYWCPTFPTTSAGVTKKKKRTGCSNTPDHGCLPNLEEATMYINLANYTFFTGKKPRNCSDMYSLDLVMLHELGHAFGPTDNEHFTATSSSSAVMYYYVPKCKVKKLRARDYSLLKDFYPSQDTVSINIQSPTENQVVIINQPNTFTANILSLKNNKGDGLSKAQLKAAEDNMVWTSSVDGVIGTGNDITPILLTGGLHDLTVTVGQPGDAIYGESFSSYTVVDTTSDIVDQYGTTIAYPFPCVRSVSRNDGACLFTVLDSVDVAPLFLDGCSNHPINYDSNPPPISKDRMANGQGFQFELHLDSIPACDLTLSYSDSKREYFSYSSWVRDTITPNSVNFYLYSQLNSIASIFIYPKHTNFNNMPIANPEIYVDTPQDCNVTNITEKCGVNISWVDKIFLPDAGIFYKENGSNNWEFIKNLTDSQDGSLNTGNIIGVNGGQLAVYQYSHNIRSVNNRDILVRAPNGLLAGPFSVKAVSSDTTEVSPELLIAETTCANHYCIKLSGHYFSPTSTVDIRLQDNQPLLKHVPASDIYTRTTENGKDVLIFPINEIELQNSLTNSNLGLCFWVNNSTTWSQPLCTKRTSSGSQIPFMNKTVLSYRSNTHDLQKNSYEVKNQGQDLEIWGNSWKHIPYSYNVTQNTVLEFSFKSTREQSEVSAIGFLTNISAPIVSNKVWQVYGTQQYGNQDSHDYSGHDWKTYRISIGHKFTGSISNMVFIADEDAHVGQEVIFRNPKLFEDINQPQLNIAESVCKNNYCIRLLGSNYDANSYVEVRENSASRPLLYTYSGNDIYSRAPWNGQEKIQFPIRQISIQNKFNTNGLCFRVINTAIASSNEKCFVRPATAPQGLFMGQTVRSYPGQDPERTSYVVAGGNNKLKIWGNSWKKISANYSVTPSTVLEFKFRSTQQEPEINGVGFIMQGSNGVADSRFWQIYGTQGGGNRNQEFHNYSGTAWKSYRIPIGEKFTGQLKEMVFIADEDTHVGQMTVFFDPILSEAPDKYDDVPKRRAFDDDVRERPVYWTAGTKSQQHNFHDAGDSDWTIVYKGGNIRFRTELIGANADTKMTVYKWITAQNSPSGDGTFVNVVDTALGSDNSFGNSEFIVNNGNTTIYAVKVQSRNGKFGAGTEYKMIIDSPPDAYDNVPSQRAFDDDVRERPVSWLGGTVSHSHNFHDAGDTDWTIVYMNGARTFRTELLGTNADTKVYIYKWNSWDSHPSGNGQFINVSDQFIASDTTVGSSSLTITANTPTVYAIKVQSRNGKYGAGTDYKLIIE